MSADNATVESVLDRAQRRTGLVDLDSDSWREGLGVVLEQLADDRVTAGGRSIVVRRAVDALANRLRVHSYVTGHPELLDAPVVSPLFVLGMPRTGTTMASHLLDQDPARRSLLNWEAVDSVPPPTTATLRSDPRCTKLIEEQRGLLEFLRTSGLGAPHWEFADEPTECMFVHEQDFKALVWDSWTPNSSYARWLLDDADLTTAYVYQKRLLQVLQSQAPGAWTLKMPSHAVFLDALLTVFPDARFVWAHRDPFTATASLCNLQRMPARMLLGDENVDADAIGVNCAMQAREHVERPMAVRDRIGEDRFFDLYYTDLVRDPIGQMRALYDWAGDSFTPETEGRMQRWISDHPQHAHGVSHYSLEEYGLTTAELEPAFDRYLARFPVELDAKH